MEEGRPLKRLPSQKMKKAKPLIPGIYAGGENRIVLNMREFLTMHGLPDTPQMRAAVREEIQEVFGDVTVYEMPDGDDLDA